MSKKKRNNSKQGTLQSCTLYVDGMHCPSCEILIEKKLLNEENIEAVDATLDARKVNITYKGEAPDIKNLNSKFEKLGYKFQKEKIKKDTTPLFSFTKSGSIAFNKSKLKNLFFVFLAVAGLLGLFFIVEELKLGKYVSVDTTSSVPTFFFLGIVAGLSSCAALVGGLLLSMIKSWNEKYIDSESILQKAAPHIMFHFGRIISFLILGGVLGFIGSTVINFDPTGEHNTIYITAAVTILISLVMIILALQMLNVEWASKLRFSAPKAASKYVADEDNFRGKYMPFGLGAATFILPCGFTIIAQTAALASGSVGRGALILFFFALGTFIPLLAISASGLAFNSKPHLTAKFNMVAGILILFFALYNINGQLNVLGYFSLNDIGTIFESNKETQSVATTTDGTQQLNFVAKGFEYIPTTTTKIKAGVPTQLIVDNQGISGCGAYMASRGLISGVVQLKKGQNVIDLGTPTKGTYKVTCSMGMVPPVTVEVV
ncbi:sulfite exporter TauE/SafE family protein [Candidatus Dojkabacteria bacterium]|uniref:Sulfite exporter TauE/SafE family protein n=1 Tax=Candidatus Dojkabacteria bacterium TaxID=2099670 RepID=A0A955RLJ3_9BACT|nr:sulfite exporter TauE/SafE family protein [Candidatus Dojkabacteria bacterium]